jgi:hypothetical protein
VSILLVAVLLLPSVAALAIADPDGISIVSSYAYRHLLEDNDQLYVFLINIDYTITGLPAETAAQAYMVRLINPVGPSLLGSAAPYAFHDSGYGLSVVMIYFAAGTTPVWNQPYVVQLVGNPAMAWVGAPPVTTGGIDQWSASPNMESSKTELANRVIELAQTLETAWAPQDLVGEYSTGLALTATGESYFNNLVPELREMMPGGYTGSTSGPDWDEREYQRTYAGTLANSLLGTPLDFTDLANSLHMSRMWTSTLISFLVLLVILYFLTRAFNVKIAMLVSGFCLIGTSLLGLTPLELGIGLGVFALFIAGFTLFYRPSGA